MPQVVHIPITGTLDLHTFNPGEINNLLFDYLNECIRREILEVKIIHGKGTGMLRERVHRLLASWDFVVDFWLADTLSGGWGATIVRLKKSNKK